MAFSLRRNAFRAATQSSGDTIGVCSLRDVRLSDAIGEASMPMVERGPPKSTMTGMSIPEPCPDDQCEEGPR
jgi:hypothetical protein